MSDDRSTSLIEELDEVDLCLLLLLLHLLEGELIVLRANLVAALDHIRLAEFNETRAKPSVVQRKTFEEITGVLSPIHFRRMFRMNRYSFERLCECIIFKVGESVFKSQEWMVSVEGQQFATRTNCATDALGGTISGEAKTAIMLRIMAGASYLDLLLIYGVSTASVYSVFHEANAWILATFQFPLVNWIVTKDTEALNSVAEGFSSASGGTFRKCFGALDGVAIKIRSPSATDLIRDPGNYFCRKGFYALNVQAICDKSRRVLWMSTGHKGSTHDSTAFMETQLFQILDEHSDWLNENGYFLVGDSAYPLMGHLLVPYSDVRSLSPEDAFNFWLSNSRIQIECAFGEIVMRWGILWRKLLFDIQGVGKVVTAAMLLHNFLVDERESFPTFNIEEAEYFRRFSLREQDNLALASSEAPSAVATDNNEMHPGGRPNASMMNHQARGKQKRDQLTAELYGSGKGRPMQQTMEYNAYGQVYFTS
jgi:DDE superfamily endonuclease